MWESVHFKIKRSLFKYKIVLFYKYIFIRYGNTSKNDQLLLGIYLGGQLYPEIYVRSFVMIPEFVWTCKTRISLEPKLSFTESAGCYTPWVYFHIKRV